MIVFSKQLGEPAFADFIVNSDLVPCAFELKEKFFLLLVVIPMARNMEHFWVSGHPLLDRFEIDRLLCNSEFLAGVFDDFK